MVPYVFQFVALTGKPNVSAAASNRGRKVPADLNEVNFTNVFTSDFSLRFLSEHHKDVLDQSIQLRHEPNQFNVKAN